MSRPMTTIDANEACAFVAHKVNEVCIIYPITPSSPMGEFADEWSSLGRKNVWGTIPEVVEMQSEAGAAGAIHGALQTGALAATFTASQGLLLMVPNMFKIAGELTPTVFHVSARSLAAQSLSIFGDHSDVMAVRQTGWAMLCSNSVQEAMDMALIAHACTLDTRIPFLHFFDGFRTSHEVSKIECVTDDDVRAMIDFDRVIEHRARALSPDHPVVRGTAQNPDTFFQGRETINPFYSVVADTVQKRMDQFAEMTGRQYQTFEYVGAPDAEQVVVLMGSAVGTAREAVKALNAEGRKLGVLAVRLFRPWSREHLLAALPKTVQKIAVLDRTKEPGAVGEPLYQDLLSSLAQATACGECQAMPVIVGGRYGLSSKEFTPAMTKAVFDNLDAKEPKHSFTVGIDDDVTHLSLEVDKSWVIESPDVVRAIFYGLGADGTVGANKNSIKIIGEETANWAQGYFVYDSKKSGSQTVSHLRFGPEAIQSAYQIQSTNFVGVHQFNFFETTDVLAKMVPGGTLLMNSNYPLDEVWQHLPKRTQQQIIELKLKVYVIDAYKVAEQTKMGNRINTIMQTCFFAISGVLERDEAIAQIKKAIKKTYGKKGDEIVQMNYRAVDQTLENLHELEVPASGGTGIDLPPPVDPDAPDFVKEVTSYMMAGRGDELPVSKLPADGTWPTATSKWEKRNVSLHVPAWDPEVCIQCGNCALVCPHSCIRVKKTPEAALADAPDTLKSAALKGKGGEGQRFVLQVAVEDCTGCTLCVGACPAKNKAQAGLKAINMTDKMPIHEAERANLKYFEKLPTVSKVEAGGATVKDLQFIEPLFEYCGACAGCGETPYVKMVSQLFGDRAIIANATGCSSIYGGNLPTTPWCQTPDGRGPSWSNSLFEDNAEFGMGFRITIDKHIEEALELLDVLAPQLDADLVAAIKGARQQDEAEIVAQRERVAQLKAALGQIASTEARSLLSLADNLVKRSVWIMGGDGWAYDIGYGGLDHVIASGRNVNILVLDTEVYSNTGGQMSKSTPRAAVAKFAAGGKRTGKKDLGLMAMCYGHVYVAKIAMGADPRQTLKAIREAEAYDGPSLVMAYSPCIAHGINMAKGPEQQKLAVQCGHWPLFRFNPDLESQGQNPLSLDSKAPSLPVKDYAYQETRYKMLARSKPEIADTLIKLAQEDVDKRWKVYEEWAARAPQG